MRNKLLLFSYRFSIWFKALVKELANNVISLFFILFVYLALWHFPQTLDLLLILNQADTFFLEVPLYFSILMVSAFIIWNAPKYFYYHNFKDIKFSNLIGFVPNQHYKFQDRSKTADYAHMTKIHMRKIIPRILGVLLLTISALSILNAMELFGLKNTYTQWLSPSGTFFKVVFFLLLLSEPKFYKVLSDFLHRSTKINTILLGITVGLVFLIISLGTLNTQAEKDLGKLFLSNCSLVFLFFTLSFNSYTFLKEFPKKIFYGTILSSGFIILITFLILNFIPNITSKINPLSILIFSLLSIFMICFLLMLIGKKIRLPLLTMVTICCVFMARYSSSSSDHYYLNLKPTTVKRLPLNQYIYHWIKNREVVIENSDKTFPVILVSAEGGGSRAGLWSFLVHSYLYEKSNGTYFKENLLSLTGASGGGVGNGMFFAEAQNALIENRISNFKMLSNSKYPALTYKASAIYNENYLSVALLSFLGRDLFKEITGFFSFKNRGQLLEEHWSDAHKKYFPSTEEGGLLHKEFLSFYKDISVEKIENQHLPPLLLINTTHTQTGNYNIISPVTYANVRPLVGMNDFLDTLQVNQSGASINLSTALRINASFPFITPVGEIAKKENSGILKADQYADAGYYDNVGGRVSIGIEQVFKKVLNDSFPVLKNRIEIKHLVIANENDGKITKTEAQLLAPLTTLKNVRYGHTKEVMGRLGNENQIMLKRTKIMAPTSLMTHKNVNDEELMIQPVLPLGRYLSTIAIRSMEARLKEVSSKLDSILNIN